MDGAVELVQFDCGLAVVSTFVWVTFNPLLSNESLSCALLHLSLPPLLTHPTDNEKGC